MRSQSTDQPNRQRVLRSTSVRIYIVYGGARKEDVIARGTCSFFYPSCIFTEVGISNVGDDERNRLCVARTKSLGSGIQFVAQFFNRFQDPLPGLVRNLYASIRQSVENIADLFMKCRHVT